MGISEERRRNSITAEDLKAIKEAVREYNSFRKNGESWWQWLQKIVTPQNVLLVLIGAYTVGGRAQRLETTSVEALETAKEAARVIAVQQDEMAAMRKVIDSQATIIDRQETMHATKGDVGALADRVSLAITRQEFQKFHREQILPRLERIERQGRQ